MYRLRKISFLTLILFAILIIYHTYLDVTGKLVMPSSFRLSIHHEEASSAIHKMNVLVHDFEIYMLVIFTKFLVLGALTFLCFYNKEFINTVIMWLIGTFFLIIESSVRLQSGETDHVSFIVTLNFIGLAIGFLFMYIVINILYNIVTDVAMHK